MAAATATTTAIFLPPAEYAWVVVIGCVCGLNAWAHGPLEWYSLVALVALVASVDAKVNF